MCETSVLHSFSSVVWEFFFFSPKKQLFDFGVGKQQCLLWKNFLVGMMPMKIS